MTREEVILLIETIDELDDLKEAIINLNGSVGYQERFPSLDNVYDVLKMNSKFAGSDDDDEFFDGIHNSEMTADERADMFFELSK